MSFNAVEDQIKEARGRAEVFASSLLKAREQEILFDEERQKWVQTFEEKSIMIEQLERELTSTVDALNQEKEEKTFVQKELVQSTWELSNLSLSLEAANQRKEPSPPVPDTSYHMRHDDYVETGASSRRVLELLQQSQEETTQARKELGAVRSERDRLSDQVSAMRRQIDRVSEDRDQLLISLKNSESKLHFRNEQITEYEHEKDRISKRDIELSEKVLNFEKQLQSERSELVIAGADLRAATAFIMSLEKKVDDLTSDHINSVPDRAVIHAPSAAFLQARFEEMEYVARELTLRAESAENSLKVLMESGAKIAQEDPKMIFQEQAIIAVEPDLGPDDSAPDAYLGKTEIADPNGNEMEQLAYLVEQQKQQQLDEIHRQQEDYIFRQQREEMHRLQEVEIYHQKQEQQQYYISNTDIGRQEQFEVATVPKKRTKMVTKTKSKSTIAAPASRMPIKGSGIESTRGVGSSKSMKAPLKETTREDRHVSRISARRISMDSEDSRLSIGSRRSQMQQNLSLGSEAGTPIRQLRRTSGVPSGRDDLSVTKRPKPVPTSSSRVPPSPRAHSLPPTPTNFTKSKPLSASQPSKTPRPSAGIADSSPKLNGSRSNPHTRDTDSVRSQGQRHSSQVLTIHSIPTGRRSSVGSDPHPHPSSKPNRPVSESSFSSTHNTPVNGTRKSTVTEVSLRKANPSPCLGSESGITANRAGRYTLKVAIPSGRPIRKDVQGRGRDLEELSFERANHLLLEDK